MQESPPTSRANGTSSDNPSDLGIDSGSGDPAPSDPSSDPSETTNVDLSNAAIIIEDLIELCRNELVALEAMSQGDDGNGTADASPEKKDDLYLRLALLLWNSPERRDDALEALEHAKTHPLVPQLLLSYAIRDTDRDLIDKAHDAAQHAFTDEARVVALRDIAETWLYHVGDPARAAAILQSIGKASIHDGLADELRHLLWVALAQCEKWSELGEAMIESATAETAPLAIVAETVHLLFDRLGHTEGASSLIERIIHQDRDRLAQPVVDDADAVVRYRILTIALDIAAASPRPNAESINQLYRHQLGLLERSPDTQREAAATRFMLGDRLRQAGDLDAAAKILAPITPPNGQGIDWGSRLANLTAIQIAVAAEDWPRTIELLRHMARTSAGVVSEALAFRAAEIADAHDQDIARSLQGWRGALSSGDGGDDSSGQAHRAIERLLLAESPGSLIAQFKALATSASGKRVYFLRRAAAIAESRARNLDQAIALQTLATESTDALEEYWPLLHMYWRKGDSEALAEVYSILIGRADDSRMCAALLCALGTLQLEIGLPKEAERTFREAAKQAPADPIARDALAGIYRLRDQRSELVAVLSELGDLIHDQATLGEILREMGLLQVTVLNEPGQARAVLERALAIEPNDATTLHALAKMHDRTRDWDQAIEFRKRALAVPDEQRSSRYDIEELDRAGLFLEIGEIEEKRRRDDEAALLAYEEAFGIAPDRLDALRAQGRIYRRMRKLDMVLEILRAELELGPEPERKLQVLLELASLSRDDKAGDKDLEAAMEAYVAALEIAPGNTAALAGIRSLGRAEKRWDLIAKAYDGAPKTTENLAVLADALQKNNDWAGYARIRTEQMKLLEDGEAQGKIAYELAEIYHRRLGQIAPALAAYKKAITCGIEVEDSQRRLSHMLEEHERWPELEEVYEQELTRTSPSDSERQIAILLRLGALRRDRLEKKTEAVTSFEAILELRPHYVPALEALEGLYSELDRKKELLRVLGTLAEATEDTKERSKLQLRIADIRQDRGEIDDAIAAFRHSFEARPADRKVFTAMEKLCYKHERWDQAMWLYQTAIDQVESGKLRAYRLGDLYARRGQVELQYLERLDDAAASYLRMLELDTANDSAIKFLEAIYSRQENWTGLMAAYEKHASLLDEPVRRIQVLRRAARIAQNKLEDENEAARIYELLLEIDASDSEAIAALENRYESGDNWDRLVGVLQHRLAATKGSEEENELLLRIAKICEEGLHDPKRAIEHYRRVLENTPGNKESLDALGRIYESTEQWAEFIDITRRQIRVTTDRNMKALLYFKCGSVMEAKFGKEEDAIRYYDAAIKTAPSCLPAVHGLRDLYRRRKDWKRVIQTLELEVKLWQDDKERGGVYAQIGRIYSDNLEQPERALRYFEKALSVDSECIPANKALFELYFEQGDWEQAHPLAQTLAQRVFRDGDPTTRSEFYRKCGIVSRMIGDPRTGAETLIVALEIQPTNQAALDALVDLAKSDPNSYEGFQSTFRELDKIYSKRDDARSHLARVRVAQAVMLEGEGDLEGAEKLYAEAIEMCPDDFAIVSALVDLHNDMRRWHLAIDAINRFLVSEPPPSEEVRLQALMRQAEIRADYEMDPFGAIALLQDVIAVKPDHQEAHYCLAQQQYVLRRFDDARQSIDRVIDLAAAPGSVLSAESLARYYYYRGRIIETSGDSRGATSQYRRAIEYDPGYAPPALALAKRSAKAGDQHQAETLLINAAHSAMEQGGPKAAVALQRGLARILLDSGDRTAAIEAYRGILNVQPDGAHDRVALAEIYAMEDVPKAISELKKVLHRDIYHAPAYRMLASLYARDEHTERAHRALSVMDLLGFAEDDDRAKMSQLRESIKNPAPRQTIDDELRAELLLNEAATEPFGELFIACASEITKLFGQKVAGENLAPIQTIDDKDLQRALGEVVQLHGVDPEIYVADQVPGEVNVIAYPRRLVIIERSLLDDSALGHRFLFGWAFEAIRGGYALLINLGRRQRTELGSLLQALLLPEEERSAPTNDFVHSLSPRAAEVVERHAGTVEDADPELWIERMLAITKRAGLASCDDFGAATRMIARINGEHPSSEEDIIALGAVMGGPDLVRFYLSDEYHKLREILASRHATPNP